ncbi:MAG: hypothetical protein V3U27_13990 [Candidatus Tectomicrobia bacterium]
MSASTPKLLVQDVSDFWLWTAIVGLGAFHGVNPAMGWLFAVALGLQEQSRAAVLRSLWPIALGHAISIAVVVAALWALHALVDPAVLTTGSAVVVMAFGVYRLLRRHKARVGMRVGFADLTLWSFLMATAHGAGLMLVPVLLQLPMGHQPTVGPHGQFTMVTAGQATIGVALAAVGIHTIAMLAVTGAIAIVVFEWVGLAFLRRGWVNLDLVWSLALIGVGAILLVPGFN